MAVRFDDISINTLVGNGSFVKGDMKVNGFIRIDGDIDGNLETDGTVILSERARIRGNITAKSAIIGGIVFGDISASDSVKLLSSSTVIGNIITHHIQMEAQVVFHGQCISIADELSYTEKSERFLQAKAIRDKAIFS